jgi:hypothetical protein
MKPGYYMLAMKKPYLIGLAVIVCLARLPHVAAEEAKTAGKGAYAEVVFVQGDDLLILRTGGGAENGDPIGLKLFTGDQIQTGAKTSVELVAMPRRSRLRLSENTVVTIGSLNADGSTSLILLYGRLRSKVEKIAGKTAPFSVVSHSFVAGVRGTDFGCDLLVPRAGEQASAKIYCFEGSVEVAPSTQAETGDQAMRSEGDSAKVPQASPSEAAAGVPFSPVVVSAGSMAVIDAKVRSEQANVVEKPIDIEIKAFWKANDFTASQPIGLIEDKGTDLAPGAMLDLAPLKKSIKIKNNAVGASFVLFGSAAGLNIASALIRRSDNKIADGLMVGGAACAAMGVPVMIYSIAIDPLKSIKR